MTKKEFANKLAQELGGIVGPSGYLRVWWEKKGRVQDLSVADFGKPVRVHIGAGRNPCHEGFLKKHFGSEYPESSNWWYEFTMHPDELETYIPWFVALIEAKESQNPTKVVAHPTASLFWGEDAYNASYGWTVAAWELDGSKVSDLPAAYFRAGGMNPAEVTN